MIKVLVVETDTELLDLMGYVLRRERFVVVEAGDPETALRHLKADVPDIVVLDLGTQRTDGLDLLRRVREQDEATPIVVLSERRSALVQCLAMGADDFVGKPFEFRELIARVRALLRRTRANLEPSAEPRLELDGLTLDPEAYEVTWNSSWVRLTPTEFRILYLLASNVGRVVPASRLYTYVWGGDGGDANALRSHISHLRHKLAEIGSGAAGRITSVPAVGYMYRRVAVAAARVADLAEPIDMREYTAAAAGV